MIHFEVVLYKGEQDSSLPYPPLISPLVLSHSCFSSRQEEIRAALSLVPHERQIEHHDAAYLDCASISDLV